MRKKEKKKTYYCRLRRAEKCWRLSKINHFFLRPPASDPLTFIFNRLHDAHLVTLHRDLRRLGRLGRSDRVKVIKRSEFSWFKQEMGDWNRQVQRLQRPRCRASQKKLTLYLSRVNRSARDKLGQDRNVRYDHL